MSKNLSLQVNGKKMDFSEVCTVEELLLKLDIETKFRAVAVNRKVVLRSDYAKKTLQDGDKIEIVRPVSGG